MWRNLNDTIAPPSCTLPADFTEAALQEALQLAGAPAAIIEKTFNYSPPSLFVNLYDKRNGTITGFIFDANAAATAQPIIKNPVADAPAVAVRAAVAASLAFSLLSLI